jgi:hypothetical protein
MRIVKYEELEFTQTPCDGANICDWFEKIGPALVRYKGDDIDGVGIDGLVKGEIYTIAPDTDTVVSTVCLLKESCVQPGKFFRLKKANSLSALFWC